MPTDNPRRTGIKQALARARADQDADAISRLSAELVALDAIGEEVETAAAAEAPETAAAKPRPKRTPRAPKPKE